MEFLTRTPLLQPFLKKCVPMNPGHPHFLSECPFSPCPCSRDGQWDRVASTERLRLEGPLEVTWSKHSAQTGPPRVTCEDHVQAAFRYLQAQRLCNPCAQHRSPFSSDPSCGVKTKASAIWGFACFCSRGKCSALSSNIR